jgi:hypothetical protein
MAAAIRLSQQHSCSLDRLVGAGEQAGGTVNPSALLFSPMSYAVAPYDPQY